MGYIPTTACNFTLTVSLTDKGREYLINGDSNKHIVKYFTLGDSDCNYIISKMDNYEGYRNIPELDFIPNINGKISGCLNATKMEQIKHRLVYTSSTNNNNVETIYYNSKAKVKSCEDILNLPIDCSYYSDEIALDSEVLVDTIWECLVENFNGTL